jgi:hypothetical protein
MNDAPSLEVHPIHLGLGATAVVEAEFTGGPDWYARYGQRHDATMTLHQEHADGTTATVTLQAGEYAINPPGTWHTADIDGEATGDFITAGMGTQHRPR